MINAFLIRVLWSLIDLIYLTDSIKNGLYVTHWVVQKIDVFFFAMLKNVSPVFFFKKRFFKRFKKHNHPI